MKLNNLIERIYNLDINKEEYDIYQEILNYPQNIFNILMINIVLGNIKPLDLTQILSKYRKKVFTEGIIKESEDIVTRLKNKFNSNKNIEVLETQDSDLEKKFLADLYDNFENIRLSEGQIDKIFISKNNYEKHTLNYDDIILQNRDYVYMKDHNLSEENMKKIKLLYYYITLKMNRKGEEKYYES